MARVLMKLEQRQHGQLSQEKAKEEKAKRLEVSEVEFTRREARESSASIACSTTAGGVKDNLP